MNACDEVCGWVRSDGTFRPKKVPTLPKEFTDKLASRKTGGFGDRPMEQFKPTREPKLGPQGTGNGSGTPKPFAPKFTPILPGTVRDIRNFGKKSLPPMTEDDVSQILDTVYNHEQYKDFSWRKSLHSRSSVVHDIPPEMLNTIPNSMSPAGPPHTPHTPTTPTANSRQCDHPNTTKRMRFVFGYIRALIRYVRITTAVHYVPNEVQTPNVSHKMVTFVGTKINKLMDVDPNIIGMKQHIKIRLYKKLYIPLVIAVRHRDELMRLRVAHKKVRGDYDDIIKRLDKRSTVGVSLSVPEINQDILRYIERYGMPEEFLFDPKLMQGIKNEMMEADVMGGVEEAAET